MKKEKVKEVLQEILRRHSQGTSDKKEAHAFATTKGLQLPSVVHAKNENKNNETVKPQTKQ
jgi:hypothetical protein